MLAVVGIVCALAGYGLGRWHRRPRAISDEQFDGVMKFAQRLKAAKNEGKECQRQ